MKKKLSLYSFDLDICGYNFREQKEVQDGSEY